MNDIALTSPPTPPFQGGIEGGNSTCVYTVAPTGGEALKPNFSFSLLV